MNKKREPYDKIAVGERIRRKRIQLGLSQDELAVRIDRATKYCSDIERGMCGMSIETMLAIAKALDMNLDYMMFGEISETEREWQQKDALTLIHIIEKVSASLLASATIFSAWALASARICAASRFALSMPSFLMEDTRS